MANPTKSPALPILRAYSNPINYGPRSCAFSVRILTSFGACPYVKVESAVLQKADSPLRWETQPLSSQSDCARYALALTPRANLSIIPEIATTTLSRSSILPMSRVSWDPSVQSTKTRSTAKPARALTGRYHRSSSINLVQGLLARLSIAEVYHTLTPTYPDTILETVYESHHDDDQFSAELGFPPSCEQLKPSSLDTLIQETKCCPSALAEEPTSRAASPALSLRSQSLQRRQWTGSPSSTISTTSMPDTYLSIGDPHLTTAETCPPPPFEIIPDRSTTSTSGLATRPRKRDLFRRMSKRQSIVYGMPAATMQVEKATRRRSFMI